MKLTKFESTYIPKEINYKVDDSQILLINEEGKLVHSLVLYNPFMKQVAPVLAEHAKDHYTTKRSILNVLAAMMNKFKVKKEYSLEDIQHLETMTTNWIVKDTIKKQFEYIYKALKDDDQNRLNNCIINIKSYISHVRPILNNKAEFELSEVYS